jgi:hypothetical protein
MSQRFVTVPAAARMFGLTRWSVRRYCQRGDWPAIRCGARYYVDLEALDRLAETQAAERRGAR